MPGSLDCAFLQVAQIAIQVASALTQVQQWINYQLSRTMVGDVTPSIDSHNLNRVSIEIMPGDKILVHPPPSCRIDVGMLQQEHNFGRIAGCDLCQPFDLLIESFRKADRA